MNSIFVIYPYKQQGVWAFDDANVGLLREPFVAGMDVIIDRAVKDIPDAERGFALIFSAQPFPGYQFEFQWRREEIGGNWYYSPAMNLEGWLCPALFKYFAVAPERLYAQVQRKDS